MLLVIFARRAKLDGPTSADQMTRELGPLQRDGSLAARYLHTVYRTTKLAWRIAACGDYGRFFVAATGP
jgi:hypothetical protein